MVGTYRGEKGAGEEEEPVPRKGQEEGLAGPSSPPCTQHPKQPKPAQPSPSLLPAFSTHRGDRHSREGPRVKMPLPLDTAHSSREEVLSCWTFKPRKHHPRSPGMIHPDNDQREARKDQGLVQQRLERVQGDREVKYI